MQNLPMPSWRTSPIGWVQLGNREQRRRKPHSALWVLYDQLCEPQAQTRKPPASLGPRPRPPLLFPPRGRAADRGAWAGGRNSQLAVCAVTLFLWVAKSFAINIVRDIKSMHSEGSSREEKAMLLTQDDPWICPGISQLRKQSAFQVTDKFFPVTDKFFPLNLYFRNSVN